MSKKKKTKVENAFKFTFMATFLAAVAHESWEIGQKPCFPVEDAKHLADKAWKEIKAEGMNIEGGKE